MRNLARRSGDYNEKSFLDIATFGEIWEWVEGVLKEGLFSASDEDGNAVIMLYNRMVGAVRAATTAAARRPLAPAAAAAAAARPVTHARARPRTRLRSRAPSVPHPRRCGCASSA